MTHKECGEIAFNITVTLSRSQSLGAYSKLPNLQPLAPSIEFLSFYELFCRGNTNTFEMSQPTSLTKTFDTSLVDLQRSFSSTETNTSGSSAKENNSQPEQSEPRSSSPYQSVPTEVLYSQWASTYDTDGNVLQAVDDIQTQHILPELVELTRQSRSNTTTPFNILDLGCGTGRNTSKLLQAAWERDVQIAGWDSSQAMLEIAKTKCKSPTPKTFKVQFDNVDLASVENVPDQYSNSCDALISTLVLEHLEAEVFFRIITKLLKSGCYALITNMHPNMGALTRAGYKTASGERFKATSHIHTVQGTVEAAENAGLEVIGDVREMSVEGKLIDGGIVNGVKVERGQVAERARKWVGTTIWYGMILRTKR